MKALKELLLAIDTRDNRGIKRLLKAHPYLFHVECPQGWPVLHRCIEDPNSETCLDLDLAKQYVAHGGDVNKKAGGGVSLLFLVATHYQSKGMADYLVSCGARMSVFEQSVAAVVRDEPKTRNVRTLRRLLDKDPGIIRQADYKGFTLIHHALRHCQYQLVPFLLDRGGDHNALTHGGMSVLRTIGTPTNPDGAACRKLLIERGAKLSANEELEDLIHVGKEDEAINYFERHPQLRNAWVGYVSASSFLHVAASRGKTEKIVNYLLSRGVDPNTQDSEGRTPLFEAADRRVDFLSGTLLIVQTLIRHGANMDHCDNEGCTPLHAMARHGWNVEPLQLLVKLGADLNVAANNGHTPLDVVCRLGFLGGKSLARWMKSQGARPGKKKNPKH